MKMQLLLLLSLVELCPGSLAVAETTPDPTAGHTVNFTVSGGYTQESEFIGGPIAAQVDTLTGYNLGVKALLPFQFMEVPSLTTTSFVLGGGAKYISVGGSQDSQTTSIQSLSLEANTGVILKYLRCHCSLIALANLGYGIYDNIQMSVGSSTNNEPVLDHFYYGGTLGGAYELRPLLNLGFQLVYNVHSMTMEVGDARSIVTYNEFSVSIFERYDF